MSQFKKSDDGSEQWFDQLAKQRIQERVQHRQQNRRDESYLDRKVSTIQHQQNQQEEIHDPYIKNLVESRQQQPFYGPAHLGGQVVDRSIAGNYEIEINMDALQQAILNKQHEFQQQSGMNQIGVGEADLDRIFNNRNQQQQSPALPGIRQPEQQQNGTVTLNIGFPVYRPIHQANGGGFVLAREVGVINEQLASQPYISRGNKSVYVVPQHQTQINIQEIQNNPRLLTTLVEVHAPPMASLGPLLVPAQAIVGAYMGGSRQIITDSRQHQYHQPSPSVQQQSTQFGFPIRRGILKG